MSEVLPGFILANPAVTALTPATAEPGHLDEDLRAGRGPLPDAALRRRMERDLRFF